MTFTRSVSLAALPMVGALFIVLSIIAEAARQPDVPVFASLGAAVALSRLLPLVSLSLALVAEGISAVGLVAAAGSWIHPPTDTDWPLYLAALAVPALVVATGSRRTLRASLIAAFIAATGLSALLTSSTDTWNRPPMFLALWLELTLLAGGAWLIGWGAAGFVRFLTTLTRDPLIRIRLRDALSLGPISEELPSLTPRERDVLLLVADGMSNAQIASALFLSETTVKSYLRSILSKFQLSSRTEIVALAWRTGLVRVEGGQAG